MKILLIGEIYSENIGDRLVYETTKYLLSDMFADAEFVNLDIMNRTPGRKQTNTAPQNDISRKLKIRTKIAKLPLADRLMKQKTVRRCRGYYEAKISEGCDLAVFCGGQLINDTFTMFVGEIAELLEKYNVPVVYNAVGLGKLKNWQRKMYSRILKKKNVKGVSCRCSGSRFNKTVFGGENIALSTFDTAIFAPEMYGIEREENTGCIGLGIMKSIRFPESTLVGFWKTAIRELNGKNKEWKIFTTGQTSDCNLAGRILREMNYSEEEIKNKILPRPENPKELLEILASFDRILSFRLHSHILAYSLGVPSIGISWDLKIDDFFKKIGKAERACKISDDVKEIINNLLNMSEYESHGQSAEEVKADTKGILENSVR